MGSKLVILKQVRADQGFNEVFQAVILGLADCGDLLQFVAVGKGHRAAQAVDSQLLKDGVVKRVEVFQKQLLEFIGIAILATIGKLAGRDDLRLAPTPSVTSSVRQRPIASKFSKASPR